MAYLQANTFIFSRKWQKLTHFYELQKTQYHSHIASK